MIYRKTRRKGEKGGNYRARYTDADGEQQDHVIILANGSKVTDNSVAQAWLRERLTRVQRESVGLVDRSIESAQLPMRIVISKYVRLLRLESCSRNHLKQSIGCLKWLAEEGGIARLADFKATNIVCALAKLERKGLSPRTVNVYRRCAHSLGAWAADLDPPLIPRNPVTKRSVKRRNEAVDCRKVRRALHLAEAYRLLAVSGPRRLFYATALWTGLRVSEIASLEWRNLDLSEVRPSYCLRAAQSKSKRLYGAPSATRHFGGRSEGS